MRVILVTALGEVVATKEIPSFVMWPDVLIWGNRTFRVFERKPPTPAGVPEATYIECFCFWMPTS